MAVFVCCIILSHVITPNRSILTRDVVETKEVSADDSFRGKVVCSQIGNRSGWCLPVSRLSSASATSTLVDFTLLQRDRVISA